MTYVKRVRALICVRLDDRTFSIFDRRRRLPIRQRVDCKMSPRDWNILQFIEQVPSRAQTTFYIAEPSFLCVKCCGTHTHGTHPSMK